ncbi:type II toxin-antitoxin system prevent-host-death family antitoxin [Thermodesulfobium sp. 4217-1]|uniref:type II toxin-antitoxin system Phd/YefM family antitoxin n=1 Tax=Thermodesulfobium sp. 4217-1 TaxID=3120013 RepID=UPI003222164E
METIFYSKARSKLAKIMDKVTTDHTPITIVRRKKGNVVLISEENLRSYEETAYLLKSINNATRLHESTQGLLENKGEKHNLME